MEAGLQVRDLRKRVGGWELAASFDVAPGSRAVLAGPSGFGKSTLLRLLAGLDRPDEGSIRLDGLELAGLAPEKRGIGYVFQEPALFPGLSVAENAAFGLRARGVPARERRERALEWLARVNLADRADDPVHGLSGGERSRVAFVRALVFGPRLILLDEPFSSLDPGLRSSLREALARLHEAAPAPLILVTHAEEDARALGTKRLSARAEGGRRLIT